VGGKTYWKTEEEGTWPDKNFHGKKGHNPKAENPPSTPRARIRFGGKLLREKIIRSFGWGNFR